MAERVIRLPLDVIETVAYIVNVCVSDGPSPRKTFGEHLATLDADVMQKAADMGVAERWLTDAAALARVFLLRMMRQ